MHPILGLVGPSGSGKTSIILELLKRLPDKVAIAKSLTTRPRRGPEDDLFYDFVSVEEINKRKAAGRLFDLSEYANNFYAFDRDIVDKVLVNKIGLQALVESALDQIQDAGYKLFIVKIIPIGTFDQRSQTREQADAMRSKTNYTPDLIVENKFEPGGLDEAVEKIINFLSSSTPSSSQ